MAARGDVWRFILRFWLPVIGLCGFATYSTQTLIRAHIDPHVAAPNYFFECSVPALRGAIYDASKAHCPLVKSVPFWEYRLDPVALTNHVVKPPGEKIPRTSAAILKTISTALKLDYDALKRMSQNSKDRYQYLAMSADPDIHKTLASSKYVAGVAIHERQVRQYLHGRRLSHVLGFVNVDHVGLAGIELKYQKQLAGVSGRIRGMKDAHGNELYDKRITAIEPIMGVDIYLTIDHNIQYEVEEALAAGVREFGAGSGWCVVLDARTAAVLAMASVPDFDPVLYVSASPNSQINRVVNFPYEPGSVMKVITAAAGIDMGRVSPGTLYNTDRHDDRYFKLPGDGSHKWETYMSIRDAVVHSSNIVIGKLGVDLGPKTLWTYMREFGFGQRTGVELPREDSGLLPFWKKWDKVKWSRAPIGQGVCVTAMQLASAYQAIANDGVRMRPYIVERIVPSDGSEPYQHVPTVASRPIKAITARTMRDIMLGVASKDGTARRAAVRGYSVAGKTGTAQKVINGHYSDSLYRATFCGIVPASKPSVVILVALDFDERTRYHQGGNSSAPIFRRIATAIMRYMMIEPDRPSELEETADEDEFDKIVEKRMQNF